MNTSTDKASMEADTRSVMGLGGSKQHATIRDTSQGKLYDEFSNNVDASEINHHTEDSLFGDTGHIKSNEPLHAHNLQHDVQDLPTSKAETLATTLITAAAAVTTTITTTVTAPAQSESFTSSSTEVPQSVPVSAGIVSGEMMSPPWMTGTVIPGHAAKTLSPPSSRAKMSLNVTKPQGPAVLTGSGSVYGSPTHKGGQGISGGKWPGVEGNNSITESCTAQSPRINRARKTLPKPSSSQVLVHQFSLIKADNCIIHCCCETENQPIKQLTDKTWWKIEKCAAFYLDKPDSKYHSLSEKIPKFKSGGYHSACYKRFTSVPSSAISPATSTPCNIHTSSSEPPLRSATSDITVSSSGVFDDVCLFCNNKCIKANQKKQYPNRCTLDSAESYIKELAQGHGDSEFSAKVVAMAEKMERKEDCDNEMKSDDSVAQGDLAFRLNHHADMTPDGKPIAVHRKRKRKLGTYSFGPKKKNKSLRHQSLLELLQGKARKRTQNMEKTQDSDRLHDEESDPELTDTVRSKMDNKSGLSKGTGHEENGTSSPTSDTMDQNFGGFSEDNHLPYIDQVRSLDGEEKYESAEEEDGEESDGNSDISSESSGKRKRGIGKSKLSCQWLKPNSKRSKIEKQKYAFRNQGIAVDEQADGIGEANECTDGLLRNTYLPEHNLLIPAESHNNRLIPDFEDGLQELPLCSCRMEAPKNREISKLSSGKCMATESINGQLTRCILSVVKQETMRPSSRVQLMVMCEEHRTKMGSHHCCPGCGFFCSSGTFLECQPEADISHRFHARCVSCLNGQRFCPHCGDDASSAQEKNILSADTIPLSGRPSIEFSRPPQARMSGGMSARIRNTGEPQSPDPSIAESSVPETALKNGLSISASGLLATGGKEVLEQALLTLHTERPKKLRFTSKHLYTAARQGEMQKVLLLLIEGLEPNNVNENQGKKTPMHAAAEHGHVEVLHILIQAGGNIDPPNDDLRTPLLLAAENNQLEVTKYLIKAGASLRQKDDEGATCLHLAAKKGNLNVVQFLLSTGQVNVNSQDDGGWTPIIWASEYKHLDVVKLLLSRGSDITIRDNEENVCLHWAAFSGSVDVAEVFLNAKCDLSAVNLHGDTPLHIAARENHYECVVLFLARGADVDVKNKEGESPVECAALDTQLWLALRVNRKLREVSANRLMQSERILTRDVARGYENIPIACVNRVDDEGLPGGYKYVAKSCETSPMNIDRNITHLQYCNCLDDCSSSNCLCGQLSIRCWYDKDGRLLPEFNRIEPPLIFECNHACSCTKACRNRMVQNGIRVRLQLYKTEKMGFGVRVLHDISPGTFICEYVGEIISDAEADIREDDSYLFDLDNKDGEVYCIDARHYGNISRFINHLCEPNLIPVRVFMCHQDLRFPRIAFFSSRHIATGEELGFDYGERFWDIKSRYFTCQCGSEKCKHSAEMITQRHAAATRLDDGGTVGADINFLLPPVVQTPHTAL
uniref:histone-lysine N-methyltransferase EHMT2-like isoform X3 n=1 Tax=Myxine glutinosa TaxID=7769 RepID=UPI00358FF7E5